MFRRKKALSLSRAYRVSPVLEGLGDTMYRLAQVRPVFHAEADFQHALAWQIREDHPQAQVRLETRPLANETMYLDMLIRVDSTRLAIECKYLVNELSVVVDGEEFRLRNQAAHDVRRYDTMKDIARIEHFIREGVVDSGVVLVLTNAPTFWRPGTRATTFDEQFRLTEGRTVTGELGWAPKTGAGTMKNREAAIVLAGEYQFRWSDYSNPVQGGGGTFRYLAVSVGPPAI